VRARRSLLVALLLALPTAAAGQGLSIDLSDPDPVRLAELPAITPAEIELLRELAGLDPREFGERGAVRSIPRERWLAWLPYLEGPSAEGGSLRGRVRGRTERSAAGVFRDRLELSLRGLLGGLDLRRAGTFDPRARRESVGVEGKAWARPAGSIEIALGSIVPGLGGPDPWDDPLRAGTFTTPVLPAPSVGTRKGARGGALRAGPVEAAGATLDRRASMLLFAGGGVGGAFWGRSRGQGEGWGVRARWRALSIAAVLHRPSASPPVLRWVAVRGTTAIASAWSLGEEAGKPTARVDATHGARHGGSLVRIAASALVRGSSQPAGAALRARVSARGPAERSGELLAASRRLRCDLVWGGGKESALRGGRVRIERSRAGAMGSFVLEGSVRSGARRLELALLARTDGRAGWPLPDASDLRGPLGLRGRVVVGLPRGSLAARVLAPLGGGARGPRAAAIRLEIERDAGP
jgi:hypothetical protein